jgi:hypothetical protein
MKERKQARANAPAFDVESALTEIVDAIEEGARPMTTAHVRDGFKARFRDDFTFLSNNGVPYAPNKNHLLALARAVGALARALTVAKATVGGTKLKEDAPVDEKSAYLAGFLVARISKDITARARAEARMEAEGSFCQNYYLVEKGVMAPSEAERGAAGVLSFFGHLKSAN